MDKTFYLVNMHSFLSIHINIYALTLFLARPITGKQADKVGTSKVILPGMLCLMAALFLLVKASSLPVFLIASVFYGLGFGAIQPILNALSVSLAPAERRGAANATFLAAMDLEWAFVLLAGVLFLKA